MKVQRIRIEMVKDGTINYAIDKVDSPRAVLTIMQAMGFEHSLVEHFVVLGVSTKNNINVVSEIAVGAIGEVLVDMRMIFTTLLAAGCSRFIVSHNHPSGDPEPSKQDIECTERISECAKLMGYQFLDHVIVGDGQTYSFKSDGLL